MKAHAECWDCREPIRFLRPLYGDRARRLTPFNAALVPVAQVPEADRYTFAAHSKRWVVPVEPHPDLPVVPDEVLVMHLCKRPLGLPFIKDGPPPTAAPPPPTPSLGFRRGGLHRRPRPGNTGGLNPQEDA